ncbi:THO complex subunit 5 homolog [Bacillus rossius redtenbacheri]|uniref:THO complex subunit 5 homolog n=1 Tax=Bacillus rossius redtenbacheri TaxID=93214 RepID=UPI002FDDA2DC
MVKEADKDSPLKKRRKNSIAANGTPNAVAERDVYQEVIRHEETEAAQQDPEADKELFHRACDEVRRLMGEIAQLKAEDAGQNLAEIGRKRVEASLQFVVLKKLNRLEKFRMKSARDTLNRVKQQVDSDHLQLQNLLYEIEHLKKEVTKCLQFKSKDEEIELVSEEEFYRDAPPALTRREVTEQDGHQLKLARLEWELEQRKQLAALCNKLNLEKDAVGKDIHRKRERLDSLAPQLRTILDGTKPVQEYLSLPLDKIRRQHQVACLLPKPLFVLYVQTDAYRDACDALMAVSVAGDEEEARLFKQTLAEERARDDVDSDVEASEETTEHDKRHHRKMSRSDRLEERRRRLLLRHPLTVVVTLKLRDDNSIQLTFHYLANLHVVTVKVKLHTVHDVSGLSAGDLMVAHKLLFCLFPGDSGEESPNAANHYQLQQVGLSGLGELMPELGTPYFWAQRLAGLDFVGARTPDVMHAKANEVEPKMTVSQASVESVVKAIRQRLTGRIALCKQIQPLEKGVVSPLSHHPALPARWSAAVSQWQPVSWAEYSRAPHAQPLVREGAVGPDDSFYRAVLSRGSARLVALVAVACSFPQRPPLFSLLLQWHGEHHAACSDAVRDMEREVNVHWTELVRALGRGWSERLLTAQVIVLLCCFDLYLESEGATGVAPTEFPRDKIFFKPVKGRNRSRPYRFLPIGGGIYTQR